MWEVLLWSVMMWLGTMWFIMNGSGWLWSWAELLASLLALLMEGLG